MREKLIALLKEMERQIPPPERCHHILCFAKYGSDSEGWREELVLQINHVGKFYCFFLDDTDLDTEPQFVAANIWMSVQEAVAGAPAQLGVAAGQFVKPDWCSECNAPQMVMPDGEHKCAPLHGDY